MKKIIALLAIAMFMTLTASCTEAQEKPKPVSEQKAEKEIKIQDLLNQRTVLQLRVQGAEAARNAVDAVISQGKVDLEILNRQIEAMTPKKVETPAKTEEKKAEEPKKK